MTNWRVVGPHYNQLQVFTSVVLVVETIGKKERELTISLEEKDHIGSNPIPRKQWKIEGFCIPSHMINTNWTCPNRWI
jgi:hypothetical protein